MLNLRAVFTTIILLNDLLLSLLDRSPISDVLNIKNHVSSEDELSWRCLWLPKPSQVVKAGTMMM
jgi:hypothetical protein